VPEGSLREARDVEGAPEANSDKTSKIFG
jgi:hypothetical protein